MTEEEPLYDTNSIRKKLNKLNPDHRNICKVYPGVQDDLIINILK